MVNPKYCALNLPNKTYRYRLQTWLKLCGGNNLKIVPFFKIETREPRSRTQYYLCDTRFPCILYEKPDGTYIVIDGYHRIKKQKDRNETTGIFFVITDNMLHSYFDDN